MKLYYIEQKTYYRDQYGIDHQMADGGQMPLIYTNQHNAIIRARKILNLEKQVTHYTEETGKADEPYGHYNCIYGATLKMKDNALRFELHVYEIETED